MCDWLMSMEGSPIGPASSKEELVERETMWHRRGLAWQYDMIGRNRALYVNWFVDSSTRMVMLCARLLLEYSKHAVYVVMF